MTFHSHTRTVTSVVSKQPFPLLPEMSSLNYAHEKAGLSSSAPASQTHAATSPKTRDLKTPTIISAFKPLLHEPHRKFISVFIHTAKCDCCERRNKSVLQRCTICNMQICEVCSDKSMTDGQHLVNEEEVDWTPKANHDSNRTRAKGKSQNKSKASKKGRVARSGAIRVEKQKQSSWTPRAPTPKRIRLAKKRMSRKGSEDGFFVGDYEAGLDGGETDDDFNFGVSLHYGRAAFQAPGMRSDEPRNAALAMGSPESVEGDGQHLKKGKGKEKEQTPQLSNYENHLTRSPSGNQYHHGSLAQDILDASEKNEVIFSFAKERRIIEAQELLVAARTLIQMSMASIGRPIQRDE